MSVFNSKNFPGLYPVIPLLNGEGKVAGGKRRRGKARGGERKGGEAEGWGRGEGCVMAVGGWTPL